MSYASVAQRVSLMARATQAQLAERIQQATVLLQAGTPRAAAIAEISESCGLTVRQARRIVTQAEQGYEPRKPLEPKPEAGTVYIIRHKLTGMVKVGATSQWEHRWSAFRSTCEVLAVRPTRDFRRAERAMLNTIAPWRLPGTEWAAPCAALVLL